jgi:ketosteroid isomerase-like protein
MAEATATAVTPDLVVKAYEALMTGDVDQIGRYWAEDMIWLVPGHNRLSGWYHGRDAFIAFMGEVGALSGGSFSMTRKTPVTIGEDFSADITRNVGYRAGHDENTAEKPYTKLDIDVVHVLRWRDGKVIEGKGAIFGDGTTEYDQFWSPRADESGERE